VKAAAPQAPVSANAKNRKTPGTSHSEALGRGLSKGSALFLQLMSARAAAKHAAGLTATRLAAQSEGLKGPASLAALLKLHLPVVPTPKLPEILPGTQGAEEVAAKERLDAARKASRTKSAALDIHAAQLAANTHQKAPAAGKEQKQEAAQPQKAPLGEVKAVASRPEPLIRILDLRHAEKPHASTDAVFSTAERAPGSDKDASSPITLRLGAAREPFVETLPKPAPAAATHAQTPLERLREMAGSELVRATSLVLKDGGGEIRLVLKPESLGSVRIRMNVVDNAIEGRIIVDSSAVKHVFDGSVDALRRALTAEGFQTGSLQVSVGGQNADTDERQQREQAPAAVRRITAQGFERNIPDVENVSLGDLFVNLFV